MDIVARTDEVDDEAAIGPAAGGAVEECLAVGQPRDGARRGGVADEVAGVDERVAEAEETAVAAAGVPIRRRHRRRGDQESKKSSSNQRRQRRLRHAGRKEMHG